MHEDVRNLLLEVIGRQKIIEDRIAALELDSHKQSVLSDPVLTEAMKKLAEEMSHPEITPGLTWPYDMSKGYSPTVAPDDWRMRTVC